MYMYRLIVYIRSAETELSDLLEELYEEDCDDDDGYQEKKTTFNAPQPFKYDMWLHYTSLTQPQLQCTILVI